MLRALVATTRLVEMTIMTNFDESRRMALTQYAFRGFFFVKYPPHLSLAPHPKSIIIDILVKYRSCIKALLCSL